MLDEQLWDDDHMRLGLRYEGQRKPSQILDAMIPDLIWFEQQQAEMGYDWMSCAHITLDARAWLALLASEPDLDITIEDDDEALDEGPEHLVIVDRICNLMQYLDNGCPPYTRYGWASENPDDEGFYALGVWPEWDSINKAIEEDKLLALDDLSTLMEHHEEIRKDGYMHAILEDGEDTVLYSTINCEELWRW